MFIGTSFFIETEREEMVMQAAWEIAAQSNMIGWHVFTFPNTQYSWEG